MSSTHKCILTEVAISIQGKIYPSVCIASWMGFLNEFEAGERATIFIVPRDAFGNDVSSTGEELNSYNFTVCVLYANGSLANVPNITHVGWNELGIISIEFIAEKAGDLLLHVKGGKQTLNGSPLPLKVNPGDCAVASHLFIACIRGILFVNKSYFFHEFTSKSFSRFSFLRY